MFSNHNANQILTILSDGNYHSGIAVGKQLAITRSAIWKLIHTQLIPTGINVESDPQHGYRIPGGIDLLDQDKILAAIQPAQRAHCPPIDIHISVDSTNEVLLQHAQQQPTSAHFCLAEQQTAGRGRRARQWHSGFARNIALSCLWHFPQGAQALQSLSLVVGVIVLRALQRIGAQDLQLKWPNDIMWQQRKLVGIGIESRIDNLGTCYAVIGIGINLDLTPGINMKASYSNNSSWTDLHTVLGTHCDRNHVAGTVINELLIQLPQFQQRSFSPFKSDWLAHDMLHQKAVDVHTATEVISGIMQGIDDEGGLILQTPTGQQHFHMGEVSLRKKCSQL